MRILFVSNLFPPFARGGYEQWCQEVAGELAARGHSLCVLTALPPQGANSADRDLPFQVHRVLHSEVQGGLGHTALRLLMNRRRLEAHDVRETARVIAAFQPDVALIWGMWNIPRMVPAFIETTLHGRVAYYLCDYWLALPNAYIQRWQEPAKHRSAIVLKRLLGRIFLACLRREANTSLALTHPICVSRALRDKLVTAGVPVGHAQIIHGGTQVEQFECASDYLGYAPDRLRLIYLGRLEPEKGLPTVLEALWICRQRHQALITLTIYGRGDVSYEEYLRAMTQRYEIVDSVTFCGAIPRAQIPDVLRSHDVLVFPSTWEEPFARAVLEAMAAGTLVIGTTTGGTPEILTNMVTGLTYPAGDAAALAEQIARIRDNPELARRLAEDGRSHVRRYFTFERMVDDMEQALVSLGSKMLVASN